MANEKKNYSRACIYYMENWHGNGSMFIDRFETFFLLLLLVAPLLCDSVRITSNGGIRSAEHIYLFHESITGNGCFQCWLSAIRYGTFSQPSIVYTYSQCTQLIELNAERGFCFFRLDVGTLCFPHLCTNSTANIIVERMHEISARLRSTLISRN